MGVVMSENGVAINEPLGRQDFGAVVIDMAPETAEVVMLPKYAAGI